MEPIGEPLLGATFEETRVGSRHVTRGRTVTEADIVQFAMLSGDWYPLHTDAEYAAKSAFGQRIGHGFLTLSAVSGMFPMRPGDLEAFYGIDNLRFRAPVLIGDTITATFEIADKKPKGEIGTLRISLEVSNQRGEVVVTGDWLFAQRLQNPV